MNDLHETDEPFGGENLEVMRDAHNYNEFLRRLVRRYATDTSRVLDFGAGIGTFSDAAGGDRQRVHCIEPDEASRILLTRQGFNAHAGLEDIAGESVSYAFSLNVLEHIEDDSAAMGELHRVLRPGGRLFIYVPAFPILFTSMDRHVGHVRRYRLRPLRMLAQRHGFRIEHAGYADFLGFFATLAFRIFGSRQPQPLNVRTIRFYDRFIFPVSRLLSVPFSRLLGKNAYIVARRTASSSSTE